LRAGVKVAMAPLLTDLPIVALTLLLLARLSSYHRLMGGISLAGALFIAFLGMQIIRSRGQQEATATGTPRSLAKGVLVNFLSPHPYLFWLTVGGPLVGSAMSDGPAAAASFIGGFYLLLVGSKISLAVLVGRSRHFLQGRSYLLILRFLGATLIVLAALLLRDGLARLCGGLGAG